MARFASRFLFVLLLSSAIAAAAAQEAQEAEATTSSAEIAKLIQQLNAEDFKLREQATSELVEAGLSALAPLEAVLAEKESPPETKMRAEQVLKVLRLEVLRQNPIKLADVLKQARLVNQGKGDPEALTATLEQLVTLISADTKMEYKLPVGFKDLTELPVQGTLTSEANRLLKLDTGRIISIKDSIILAETAVTVSSPQNCIIIAGVSASVTSPRNCLIIAGRNVDLSASSRNLNYVLSGGSISGTIVRDCVLGAAGDVTLSAPDNVTVINSTQDPDIREKLSTRVPNYVESPGVQLKLPVSENSLEDKIKITLALTTGEPIALFRRKDGDGEYVARANQDILFPDGKPMPELAGWKLVYCGVPRGGQPFAVFRKDEETAVVDIKP